MKLNIFPLLVLLVYMTTSYCGQDNVIDSTQINLTILDSISYSTKDGLVLPLQLQNLTQDTLDFPIGDGLFQLSSCKATKLDTFRHIVIDTPLYFFNDRETSGIKIYMKMLPLQKVFLQVFFKQTKKLPPQGLYCRVTYIFRLKFSEEYFQSYRIVSSNKVYVREFRR